MLAAAEVLARAVSGKKLADLHGLDHETLAEIACEIEAARAGCVAAATTALRNAFADFRSRQIEEFSGEKALVCTCFGVSEEAIEEVIQEKDLRTIEGVSSITNAGSGCGSCRMLIQELLDVAE